MISEDMKEGIIMLDTPELIELRTRNEARAKAMREQMGAKWLCHPNNAPKKVDKKVGG